MNLLDIIHSLPQQIREGIQLAKDIKVSGEFSSIVVTGMGGSGIPGDLLKSILRDCKLPIIVNKDYSLPGFVNKNTLVFVISYSGNTEETISAFKDAQKKKATIITITSGGKLRELARDAKCSLIIIPQGLPPRSAVAYLLFPMLVILHNSGITKLNSAEIKATIEALKNPEYDSKAKELAEHLKGKIPLVYAGPQHEAVALRWKQEFNENSKSHAFYNVFSELDHNEITAYQNAKNTFHIILLRDEREHTQNKKRMDHLKQLLKEKKIPITEIMLKGIHPLVKIFTALYMGDLTSYYLAEKYGVDPTDTHLIEELKKQL
ncbi:MAG: bifunctional phosphoglucose/phosphomannose isomerase [Candidatus Woesearchaeota archaeon]